MTAKQWVFDKWVVWEDERDGTWNVSMDDVGDIKFNIYGGERYAFLFAHGYPALLEAVQRFTTRHGGWCKETRQSLEYVALYDAMKACEPPAPKKKTREEVLRAVIRRVADACLDDDGKQIDTNTLIFSTLRELDEAEQ